MTSEELTVWPACECPRRAAALTRLARQRQRLLGLGHRARHHHADRHHLVVRSIGGVAPARERIERDLALELCLEHRSSPGVTFRAILQTSLTPTAALPPAAAPKA